MNRSLLSLVAIATSSETGPTAIAPVVVNKMHTNGPTFSTNTTNMTNADTCDKSKNAAEAAQIIKNADVVCFDVDSTVIREEGIDELARYCGKHQEVARLTKEAMKGSMTFQEALRLRLNIIRPTQQQIRDFLKSHPSTLSQGIKEFVTRLRAQGKKVYLITGGFDCLIEPVCLELGIPLENMFANKIFFHFNGDYAGFDVNQPTSRTGGKGEAISFLRRTLHDDARIVMIGDGATDLEASPPANSFIGYGGNIIREEVRNRAHCFVTDFEQLYHVL